MLQLYMLQLYMLTPLQQPDHRPQIDTDTGPGVLCCSAHVSLLRLCWPRPPQDSNQIADEGCAALASALRSGALRALRRL